MSISAIQAAKYMGKQSDWSLSNLVMQKILYIAHMFHLGLHDKLPLVTGNFEAWDYGPVHPTLYHYVKVFGADPVQNIFHRVENPKKNTTECIMLREAVRQLAPLRGAKLIAITHWDGGAWAKHYNPGSRGAIIPNADIFAEYEKRTSAN